jgi:murein DD-endopeptidase MepM/ murein hydrolase activator NlpD
MIKLATIRLAISYRNELLAIFGTLALIISLPMICVLVIANAGVSAISGSLVSVNPTTHLVEIHDPNGNITAELSLSTTWPVAGVVTLEFGETNFPYQVSHTGIDIADITGKIGQPVTTFLEGTVSQVINIDNEYGRYVFIDHGNHIESQYWHLSLATVIVGQHVVPGDIIGIEGETGLATGPHVHFQIQVYGIPVNPRSFIVGDPPLGYPNENN